MTFAKFLRSLTVFGFTVALGIAASAQQFPSKPIRIIVGFGAAGSTDAIARLYAQKMSELLATPVLVDNKPGASQLVAIRSLIQAPADGYTLYMGTGSSLSQGPGIRKNLPYDPLKDFSLIGLVATTPGALVVSNDLPVRSIRELVEYSKANPGKLNYGSAGIGTAQHLQTEFLISKTGMNLTHITYKSDAEVLREVLAGSIQVAICPVQAAVPLIKSGKVRALMVTTSQRLPYLPNVPGLAESELSGTEGIEPYTYFGLVGPVGVPDAVVARLNDALNKISAAPDVAIRMRETLFSEPVSNSAAAFRLFLERELAKWREVGKTVKLPD